MRYKFLGFDYAIIPPSELGLVHKISIIRVGIGIAIDIVFLCSLIPLVTILS
ncbi:MAG: hypothetical protein JW768_06660 [Chitinispirillaceae bacterium]|nr:hypothetical protein [Chitinispirillaceae bacterium]